MLSITEDVKEETHSKHILDREAGFITQTIESIQKIEQKKRNINDRVSKF